MQIVSVGNVVQIVSNGGNLLEMLNSTLGKNKMFHNVVCWNFCTAY